MKKTTWLLSIVTVLLVSAVLYFFTRPGGVSLSGAAEVDWRLLGELDYISGKKSPELETQNGKFVRVPGFMVPLEDNMKEVKEFLLVPSPQACIHVPPPPPNQMVLIKMQEGSGAQVAYGPIWVYGTLRIENIRHLYGESSFQMDAVQIEPYR